MSKLKLLQVTHDLKIGGLQKLVVDIATNIDRSRFDVAVCCLRETGPFAKQLSDNNIPIYEINQIVDGRVNYLSFLDIYKILKHEKSLEKSNFKYLAALRELRRNRQG